MRNAWTLLVLTLLAGCATGPDDRDPNETAIPFVKSGGVLDWRVAADDAVYLRGGNGKWYLVRTMNRCTRLHSALALGFQTSALDQLDRHGAILAQGQRCPIASITPSGEPPKKSRRKTG